MPPELSAFWPWLLAAFVAGAVLAALVLSIVAFRRESQLKERLAVLQAEQAGDARLHIERERAFQAARDELEARFALLADQTLERHSEQFLKLAQGSLKLQQSESEAALAQRQQAIEAMVQPIREALSRTEAEVRRMEAERKQAFGNLNRYMQMIAEDHGRLREETQNLTRALRRPEVRGQWGEMTLRRLVEMAGMSAHCDFSEQVHRSGTEGRLRPDLVVHLPDERDLVVDVKTPLDAYLSAHAAADEAERRRHLEAHVRNLRQHVKALADKAYWEQFERSPDFVIMFIPGEQFLAAALDLDANLLEQAMRQNVLITTPTSLVALLRSVAFSWRQLDLIRNAEEIRGLAETLHKRVGVFTEHYAKLGRALSSAADWFNKAWGSLDRQVLPAARRLSELGVTEQRSLTDAEPIEKKLRVVAGKDEPES